MQRFLIALVALSIFSCTQKESSNLSYNEILHEFQSITAENAEFWGEDIYGPIILVDPESRKFYANENDLDENFTKENNLYTGLLPDSLNIANTGFDWGGKRWTMLKLPLPENIHKTYGLLAHESFHRIQPELGLPMKEGDNSHLDSYEGRILMRLELNALVKALKSGNTVIQTEHIKDALLFRQRRQYSDEIASSENSLEINEGIAEYTGLMYSQRNDQQVRDYLVNRLTEYSASDSFVRSFAYNTTPVYGYLLSIQEPYWHHKLDTNSNLTHVFVDAYKSSNNETASWTKLAIRYDYEQIESEEHKREQERIETIASLKKQFSDNALELPFMQMNISFNPGEVIALENMGMVYPNIRVTDKWGILNVTDGALLDKNWGGITVSKVTDVSDSLIVGSGWDLRLNEGWALSENQKSIVQNK